MDMVAELRTGSLADLKVGEKGIVYSIKAENGLRQQLAEMGFVRGAEVIVDRQAPMGNPRVYRVRGSKVSLRNEEAKLILLQNP